MRLSYIRGKWRRPERRDPDDDPLGLTPITVGVCPQCGMTTLQGPASCVRCQAIALHEDVWLSRSRWESGT